MASDHAASGSCRCVDPEEKWYMTHDVSGNLIKLRVMEADDETGEERPVDAQAYADRIKASTFLDKEEGKEAVLRKAALLYSEVPVQVCWIEDPEEEEENADDEDALDDMWDFSALALSLQRDDLIEHFILFHQRNAMNITQWLVERVNGEACVKRVLLCSWQPRGAGSQEWGEMALVPPAPDKEGEVDAEDGDENSAFEQIRLEQVLGALKPLVDFVLSRTRRSQEEGCEGAAEERPLSILEKVLQRLLTPKEGAGSPTDGLLPLGTSALIDERGMISQHRLRNVIGRVFRGALLPVMIVASETDDGNAFWLPYAPQDAQKLALLATWVSLLRDRLENGMYEGDAEREGDQARPSSTNFLQCTETCGERPLRCVHPCELSLLTALVSQRCDAETWRRLLGAHSWLFTAEDSLLRRQPASMTLLLASGVFCAEAVFYQWPVPPSGSGETTSPSYILEKVDILLSDPSVRRQLESFLLRSPSTHTECFKELWLGLTRFGGCHMFQSRVEQLYYSAVDCVLTAVEATHRTTDNARNNEDEEDEEKEEKEEIVVEPLVGGTPHWEVARCWVQRWQAFLQDLSKKNDTLLGTLTGDRSAVPNKPSGREALQKEMVEEREVAENMMALLQGDGRALEDVNGDETAEERGEDEEHNERVEEAREIQKVLHTMLESLPERMQDGDAPLPALYMATFGTGDATPLRPPAPLTLDEQFQKAQVGFGRRVDHVGDDVKLKFYGLFKQATVGDVNIPQPWIVDRVGRAKWGAWEKCRGISSEEAKRRYVDEYRALTRE